MFRGTSLVSRGTCLQLRAVAKERRRRQRGAIGLSAPASAHRDLDVRLEQGEERDQQDEHRRRTALESVMDFLEKRCRDWEGALSVSIAALRCGSGISKLHTSFKVVGACSSSPGCVALLRPLSLATAGS